MHIVSLVSVYYSLSPFLIVKKKQDKDVHTVLCSSQLNPNPNYNFSANSATSSCCHVSLTFCELAALFLKVVLKDSWIYVKGLLKGRKIKRQKRKFVFKSQTASNSSMGKKEKTHLLIGLRWSWLMGHTHGLETNGLLQGVYPEPV